MVQDAGFFQRLIEAGPAICLDALAADLEITDPDQTTVMRRLIIDETSVSSVRERV